MKDKTIPLNNNIVFGDAESSDGFSVSVRNTEPMIRLKGRSRGEVGGTLMIDIASALLICAALASFVMMMDDFMMLPLVLSGAAVFILASVLIGRLDERWRNPVRFLFIILLIAALVLLRHYVISGMALIVNSVFDMAEMAQAYVYDRLPVGSQGEEDPETCIRFTILWVSALEGFIAAIPGREHRSTANTVIAVIVMLIYAYLGIVPNMACVLVMLLTLLISYGSGRISAALPILITVGLVFGAVVLIDPGESMAVSRANENLRDIFALRSAYIEGQEEPDIDSIREGEEREQDNESFIDALRGDAGSEASIIAWAVLGGAVLLIAVAAYIIHRKISRKRRKLRAGIDSRDPNISIGAMFPYSVRWLKASGISPGVDSFSAMISDVRTYTEESYTSRYRDMLELWKEAVYSDHTLSAEDRNTMSAFMKETVSLARGRMSWKDRLKAHFRYAL